MGYKNGQWEFCYSGDQIHAEFKQLYDAKIENIDLQDWRVSDDQVMHLATAEALVQQYSSLDKLYPIIARNYVECFHDMNGRAPGGTTSQSIAYIRNGHAWNTVPFGSRAGGCGAAMRAMCVGLRFPGETNRSNLIAVAIESGRMTHNNPIGFLGALAAALFTAFAVESIPIGSWGRRLIVTLQQAYEYLRKSNRDYKHYEPVLHEFEDHWNNYLEVRGIKESDQPVFPAQYGVKERDKFYTSLSFSGWGGSSGHDAPMIAYDALLGCKSDWQELCLRAMLHGGDNDSTGVMAGAWYGALYGFKGVPPKNFANLEYRKRAEVVGGRLFDLSTVTLTATTTTTTIAAADALTNSTSTPSTPPTPTIPNTPPTPIVNY